MVSALRLMEIMTDHWIGSICTKDCKIAIGLVLKEGLVQVTSPGLTLPSNVEDVMELCSQFTQNMNSRFYWVVSNDMII